MRVGCSLTCEMGVWVLAGIGGGGGVGGWRGVACESQPSDPSGMPKGMPVQ